jgi:4-diphosphocytidyl-2-C-methyl-D-erythritol kinase
MAAATGKPFGEVVDRPAPAKVNLWLRVLGRRADGYHEIETRMVPLGLEDRVTLRRLAPGAGVVLTLGGDAVACEGVPPGEENLALRAVRAVEAETGAAFDVAVHLDKRIPSGAGLGGGSSDAAAVLGGLDELFGLGFGTAKLAAFGARIGADVAFFCHGGACDCRGVGEVVEPVEFGERLDLLLVKPAFGVPTAWAYRQWAAAREAPVGPQEPQRFPWGELANDLERPVFRKFLLLPVIKEWLLAQPGVRGALMSGSGSTVFAVLEDAGVADALAAVAREAFGKSTWVCATGVRPVERDR